MAEGSNSSPSTPHSSLLTIHSTPHHPQAVSWWVSGVRAGRIAPSLLSRIALGGSLSGSRPRLLPEQPPSTHQHQLLHSLPQAPPHTEPARLASVQLTRADDSAWPPPNRREKTHADPTPPPPKGQPVRSSPRKISASSRDDSSREGPSASSRDDAFFSTPIDPFGGPLSRLSGSQQQQQQQRGVRRAEKGSLLRRGVMLR